MEDHSYVYAFEELGEDLPRPPMAALRALLSQGVVISARAWHALPPPTRLKFALAGLPEQVDEAGLQAILREVPVSQIKFVGKTPIPSRTDVPALLIAALGPQRAITSTEWSRLRPLDRQVLTALASNRRLLSRALLEIFPDRAQALSVAAGAAGAVARCEVRLDPAAIARVLEGDLADSRAFVLANVAGRRAARRASEVFDAQDDNTVGPVEINWGAREAEGILFWQAHVSSWDGAFFPAASLLAATTAAAAFYDFIKGIDPQASIIMARVAEEPWVAGQHEIAEGATALFTKPSFEAAAPVASHDTVETGPPDLSVEDRAKLAQQLAFRRRHLPPGTRVPSPTPSTPELTPSGAAASVPGLGRAIRKPALPLWAVALMVSTPLLALFAVALAAMALLKNPH